MGLSHHGYVALTYSLGVLVVVAFFTLAMVYSYLQRRNNQTVEAFLTARHRVSTGRIAWAFYAAAVGAWVITSPAAYTPYAGVIGCVFYAIATGAPLLVIAYVGEYVQRAVPQVLSLTDYAGWRYGIVGRTWVISIVCLNMGIGMLAEYTTIGALFGPFVGTKAFIMIVVVGVATMLYTAYGGLLISILTDQVQGATSVTMLLVLVIYLAVKFRTPLPHPMPCDPNDPMGFCISGTNVTGWSSIFSMPASLLGATVFSEAMWQRVWASDSKRTLRRGAWLGFIAVTLAVFITGFTGLLAAWGGLITAETDGNLYLFAALPGAIDVNGHVGSWIAVVLLLCAVVMNMSAVDSMQNGLTAAISSAFLKGRPLLVTRLAVICINVPVMVVATKGYTILQLFLISNLVSCTSAAPVLAGLLPFLRKVYGPASLMFSTLISITAVSIYGVDYAWDDSLSRSKNIQIGMRYAWMENNYDWRIFMVTICCSIGGVVLSSAFNWLILRARGGRQLAIPGFTSAAMHPELYERQGQEAEDKAIEELEAHDLGKPAPSDDDSREGLHDVNPEILAASVRVPGQIIP